MRSQAVVLLAAFALTAPGNAADPDPMELGRKSSKTLMENRAPARQYAFREYFVHRELDAKGKETDRDTETWDIIGLEGSTYRKLILRNDKPLSGKEQKREDERMAKEAALRRRETPEQRRARLFSFTYSYSMPYDRLADVFTLRYLGERDLNGQSAWVIEAIAKSDFKPASENERQSFDWRFELWLDQRDCYPARIDGEIISDHARLQKGSRVREDSAKLPDGTWMTKSNTVWFAAKIAKLFTARGEAIRTYSDFHKFQTDSRIVEIGEK